MKASIIIIAIAALLGAGPASAHLVSKPDCDTLKCRLATQQQNLGHVKYVSEKGGGYHKSWAKQTVGWLTKELNETRTAMSKTAMPQIDSCLRGIIALENKTMNPTLYNYAGSGAYGIPQALPGHKMASAGADWRTNPATQIRWMIGYVNGRYGGSCPAYQYRISRGYY